MYIQVVLSRVTDLMNKEEEDDEVDHVAWKLLVDACRAEGEGGLAHKLELQFSDADALMVAHLATETGAIFKGVSHLLDLSGHIPNRILVDVARFVCTSHEDREDDEEIQDRLQSKKDARDCLYQHYHHLVRMLVGVLIAAQFLDRRGEYLMKEIHRAMPALFALRDCKKLTPMQMMRFYGALTKLSENPVCKQVVSSLMEFVNACEGK